MSDISSNVQQAYNEWAEVYDTNTNPTRDLNYKAIRKESFGLQGKRILELGCGTGLNTEYLAQNGGHVTGVDLSERMLAKARQRIEAKNVSFLTADITKPWDFKNASFDFIVANLVLEHIQDLRPIFNEVFRVLRPGGKCYLAELHPFKQLRQSQAKYVSQETGEEVLVDAFTHMISEYINEGLDAGLHLCYLKEYHQKEKDIPRLLTLLMEKK